jgi:hypothetical protein
MGCIPDCRASIVLIVRVISGVDTLIAVPIFELAAVVGPNPSIDAWPHHDTVRFDVTVGILNRARVFDIGVVVLDDINLLRGRDAGGSDKGNRANCA